MEAANLRAKFFSYINGYARKTLILLRVHSRIVTEKLSATDKQTDKNRRIPHFLEHTVFENEENTPFYFAKYMRLICIWRSLRNKTAFVILSFVSYMAVRMWQTFLRCAECSRKRFERGDTLHV